MAKIPQRLRKIDSRIAGINRRLGFLESFVYFKPTGELEWLTIDINSFTDNGITPENLGTGEELSAHRFTITVNRDFIDEHQHTDGEWAVQRPTDLDKIPCNKESESYQEGETFATIELAVSQDIPLLDEIPMP